MFSSPKLERAIQERLFFWGVLFISYVSALYVRFEVSDLIQVYSDSLSPYLAAGRFLNLGFSEPPNPEADHWLWVTAVPQVLVSTSLQDIFFFRTLISALVAPIGAAIIWEMSDRDKMLSSLLGGVVLAADQGLVDTLLSSFRGYMAPEWVGIASLFFALGFKNAKLWCFVPALLVIAGGHHPLALGALLSTPLFLIWGSKSGSWRWIIVLFLGASLPRLFWMFQIAQCDAGGLECFTQIATGSSEQNGFLELIYRGYKEHFVYSWGTAGAVLSLGVFFSRAKVRWLVIAFTLGITALGLSLTTFRPYHLRIVSVPLIAFGVAGWTYFYWGKWLVLMCSIWFLASTPAPSGVAGATVWHDARGAELLQLSRPLWLEGTVESELSVSASGVVFSAWLQGLPKEALSKKPKENITVLLPKGLMYVGTVEQAHIYLQQLTNNEGGFVGGHDWATVFFKAEEVELEW
ncbi:MAG: hypothetical protein CMK59_01020 [Proteobacteria bacterium]|nr:hypothetical protein [Pseudomonadota bacterium]